MDLNVIIEKMEMADQDAVLMALQSFNNEKGQCFTFNIKEQEKRERLGELAMDFLKRDLQPSCQLACLETIRILSRDKGSLGPFSTRDAMRTLSRYAGLAREADGTAPDSDVIVEALKCLCNVVFTSEAAREVGSQLGLVEGLAQRLKQCRGQEWGHAVRFFDLRLTFLLTALRVDARTQLARELRGVSLLSSVLDATLGLRWFGPFEVERADVTAVDAASPPPLGREETERAMEILKILFNITLDTSRRKVDEEEAMVYRHLVAILRHCLMSTADGEDRTEEFHSHTVNLLGNLPLPCLDVLLIPKVQQGSIEYMGVNMDSVSILLQFMEKRLDRGNKLKETLLPSLNLLTESARVHRETRKFLRMKILPPLRDVKNRPEVGNALRNKLVRLMTHIDTDVKHCAAEFLFVLCKESVSRFIKYTGYGNAAGLLAARGLMQGARDPGHYSEDEDSDTEEYREAKPHINPVTGRVEDEQPNPMDGMTEEQKEYEAMKLVNMFDKLSRDHVIQPMTLGPDGKMTSLETADLQRMTQETQERQGSDSNSEAD